MKVKECMTDKISFAKPEATVKEVATLMMDEHVGCIPICDNNKKIVGLVTDRDLILRTIACDKNPSTTPVSEVMTTKVYNVAPDSEISEASKIMCDYQVKRVPVIEDDQIVGIITVGDLANNQSITSNDVGDTVEKICKCDGNAKNSE